MLDNFGMDDEDFEGFSFIDADGLPEELMGDLAGALLGAIAQSMAEEQAMRGRVPPQIVSAAVEYLTEISGYTAEEMGLAVEFAARGDLVCDYCGTQEGVCPAHRSCQPCHLIHYDEVLINTTELGRFIMANSVLALDEGEIAFAAGPMMIYAKDPQGMLDTLRDAAQKRREQIETGGDADIPDAFTNFFGH